MKNVIMIGGLILALSGCATKQYPQAVPVSGAESTAMDCNALKLEIAKTRALQNEIEATGQFDGRTVLGFLGDFGIGNGMAKSEARKKSWARMHQLEALQSAKCQGQQ